MTFWNKRFDNDDDDEVPEELKGKSPKEVAAALKAAKALETELATQKTAAETATAKLTAQQNEFDQLKTKVTELEARGSQKTAEELEVERLAAEPASPWVDPEKFVADQTKKTHDIALNSGLMSAKMYFTQNISSRDQRIFKKYEGEVERVIGTFAPEQRVMPQSWLNAFMLVKGWHEVEIAKAESSKTDFFSETASRGSTPEPEPEDKLTEEEEAICKSMHWNPETYLKNRKKAVVVGHDRGQHASFTI